MAHPVTVSDSTFKAEVIDSDVPVLVDFWAAWCSPCKMIAPLLEELAGEYGDRVKIAKLDIDANPVTMGQFGVMSIPTLIVFRGGAAQRRIVGYQPKARLKGELDAVLEAGETPDVARRAG
ncbi:MAG TPA: thioredoxin [Candidatus Dormibacteraeota bacterium]